MSHCAQHSPWVSFVELGLVLRRLFNNPLTHRSVVLVEWYLWLCSIMRFNHFPCFTHIVRLSRIVVGSLVFCVRFPVGARILWRTQLGAVDVAYPFFKTCPRSFSFLSSRISVSGLICLPGPSDGALRVSIALLYTYSIHWNCCAARTWCVVSEFVANPLASSCFRGLQSFQATKDFRSDDGVENE